MTLDLKAIRALKHPKTINEYRALVQAGEHWIRDHIHLLNDIRRTFITEEMRHSKQYHELCVLAALIKSAPTPPRDA